MQLGHPRFDGLLDTAPVLDATTRSHLAGRGVRQPWSSGSYIANLPGPCPRLTHAEGLSRRHLLAKIKAMSRDHYLPAAFMGGFSIDTSSPRARERPLWVGFRNDIVIPVLSSAQSVGFRRDFYTVADGAASVDAVWSGYESKLLGAIAELLDPTEDGVSAETWLRTLVPFVAGLFVRGPDFDRRFDARIAGVVDASSLAWQKTNRNQARLLEMQRLLAPVMAARWVLVKFAANTSVVTNELGLALTGTLGSDKVQGWVVPLNSKAVLGILPTPGRRILVRRAGRWRSVIETVHLTRGGEAGLNESMAHAAREFVLGPTQSSVAELAPILSHKSPLSDSELMQRWPFSHRMLVVHDLEWFRIVSAVCDKDTSKHKHFEVDAEVLAQGWVPPIHLAVNLPPFLTGLRRRQQSIYLNLSGAPGFTS